MVKKGRCGDVEFDVTFGTVTATVVHLVREGATAPT